MTIKRLWLITLVIISTISIGINALILTSLTNRYFKNYLEENYEKHVKQVIDYTKITLMDKNTSFKQMTVELESHLSDPITGIRLYSKDGELLVDVSGHYHLNNFSMMAEKRIKNIRYQKQEEIEQYKIMNSDELLGILHVTKYNSAQNSVIARMFKSSLIINSIYSMLIALLISFVIGMLISRRMTIDLTETATLANDIQAGINNISKKSFISEINGIRESLDELNTRLKIKQKSRKELIDQLMHQTRTPLTILKSHLEGLEDGIIQMNDDEIEIWQNQINNITDIISNMAGMIDGNKENDEITKEEFEITSLISQIINGLKAQFNKKNIALKFQANQKIVMKTDQYKLSQVIYNLLTNAYKYTEENGKVEITCIALDKTLTISVKDTGMGIDLDEIDKIFRAYYRSKNVSKINGEGIGLYVVEENLKLLRGTIRVESQKNVGSNFILMLPID